MKKEIIKIAKMQSISDVGFCSVSRYIENAKKLQGAKTDFVKKSEQNLPENAKTVIVFAFNYWSGAEKGNISRYAMGRDYHKVAQEKMLPIADYLKENGYSAECYADTGYLNERILAKESGVAFLGENQMAISEKFGSWFFIGYILTDCELSEDVPNNKTCIGCGSCKKACPLGALADGFDENKCLSYITQKKGELSKTEQEAMLKANTAWGCDICQEVCPHNQNARVTEIAEFRDDLVTNLDVDFEISNKKFSEIYKNRAFSWRGKDVVIRNLKILKKNEKK